MSYGRNKWRLRRLRRLLDAAAGRRRAEEPKSPRDAKRYAGRRYSMSCRNYVHKIKQGQRQQRLSNTANNIVSLTPWCLKLRVGIPYSRQLFNLTCISPNLIAWNRDNASVRWIPILRRLLLLGQQWILGRIDVGLSTAYY